MRRASIWQGRGWPHQFEHEVLTLLTSLLPSPYHIIWLCPAAALTLTQRSYFLKVDGESEAALSQRLVMSPSFKSRRWASLHSVEEQCQSFVNNYMYWLLDIICYKKVSFFRLAYLFKNVKRSKQQTKNEGTEVITRIFASLLGLRPVTKQGKNENYINYYTQHLFHAMEKTLKII